MASLYAAQPSPKPARRAVYIGSTSIRGSNFSSLFVTPFVVVIAPVFVVPFVAVALPLPDELVVPFGRLAKVAFAVVGVVILFSKDFGAISFDGVRLGVEAQGVEELMFYSFIGRVVVLNFYLLPSPLLFLFRSLNY